MKFKKCVSSQISVGISSFVILLCGLAYAQDTFSNINISGLSDNGVLELSGTNISSFQTFSDDELNALVDVLDATPTVSTPLWPNGNMMGGTFWSLQKSGDATDASQDTIGMDALADGRWQLSFE